MIKKYWKKTIKRIKEHWTETELFMKRFYQLKEQNLNYCMITWKLITEDMLTPASFPHLLSKKMYSEFRYSLNNIWLVLWIKEHNEIDRLMNLFKKDIWVLYIQEMLKDWREIFIYLKNYIWK